MNSIRWKAIVDTANADDVGRSNSSSWPAKYLVGYPINVVAWRLLFIEQIRKQEDAFSPLRFQSALFKFKTLQLIRDEKRFQAISPISNRCSTVFGDCKLHAPLF